VAFHPLQALLAVLGGYFALQIVQNIIIRALAVRSPQRIRTVIKGSFWASVVNAVYFIVVAILLHIWNLAPNDKPSHMAFWALMGLPCGAALWWLSAQARALGIRWFGYSNIVAGEDAVLRHPPDPQYIGWGITNQSIIQPLGRELFLRGAFLPMVVASYGWAWGIAATLIVEIAPRLNVVWLPLTLTYSLFMCGLYYSSDSALCGLVAAAVSGMLHSCSLAFAAKEPVELKRYLIDRGLDPQGLNAKD
jgi:hypothetical protein